MADEYLKQVATGGRVSPLKTKIEQQKKTLETHEHMKLLLEKEHALNIRDFNIISKGDNAKPIKPEHNYQLDPEWWALQQDRRDLLLEKAIIEYNDRLAQIDRVVMAQKKELEALEEDLRKEEAKGA